MFFLKRGVILYRTFFLGGGHHTTKILEAFYSERHLEYTQHHNNDNLKGRGSLYAVKVRRHNSWSRGPLSWLDPRNVVHAMSISLVNWRSHRVRITLKSTTLLFMRRRNVRVNHETVTTELVIFLKVRYQGRSQDFHLGGGGGGQKIMCAQGHYERETRSPKAQIWQGPRVRL